MPPVELMRMRNFLPEAEKDNLRLANQVTFCKQNVSICAIIPCVSSKTWYNKNENAKRRNTFGTV